MSVRVNEDGKRAILLYIMRNCVTDAQLDTVTWGTQPLRYWLAKLEEEDVEEDRRNPPTGEIDPIDIAEGGDGKVY